MHYRTRRAKVNIKVLVVAIVAPMVVIGGLFAARHIRRVLRVEQSLALGLTAFENRDWEEAHNNFRAYLRQRPDDLEILKKYAEALWSVRPLDGRVIAGLISAYSQIMEREAVNETAYERLATLYAATRQFDGLAQVAQKRLAQVPDDRNAPLWQADALMGLNKPKEAREILTTFIERLEGLAEKHVEYVRACVKMSVLSASEGTSEGQTIGENGESSEMMTPREWLDRAVAFAPDSAEALAYRARFFRLAASSDMNEDDRLAYVARAHNDLMAADVAGTNDPRILSLLAVEWIAHGEFDRAAVELEAADGLPRDKIEEHFFDFADWTVTRFRIAFEVATRRGDTTAAVLLADETLALLSEARHRNQILPAAIRVYTLAGQVAEARRYLDEYLKMLREGGGQVGSPMQLAGLQALVASLENRPDAVIDALEPVVGDSSSNPGVLRLMADAYVRTGQSGRAISTLNQYLALNPDDAQATHELAKQYSRLGEWGRAYDYAGRAESLGATGIGVKLLRIGAAASLTIGQTDGMDTERLKQLAQELEGLREANLTEVNIRIFQALIASYLGQPEEAERHLKLAVKECENKLRARIQLAAHYRRTGQGAEAIEVCREACNRHSEVAMPWLLLADLYTANADHDAARNCLREGLNAVGDKQEKQSVSIKLALLELVHGDRATGVGLLKEMAAQDELEAQARSLLLGIPEIRRDQTEAEKLIAELKKAEGQRGRWWRLHQASLWLSSEAWRAKQSDISNLLQYCIDAVPNWPAPVVLLAGMHNRLGEPAQVEDVCRRGLQENPSATEIADILLEQLYRQNRFTEAQEILSRLRISPRAADDWQVRIARGMGDILSAIDRLKLRVADDDQNASARIELARLVYQETQDADEAFRHLREAEAINPGSRTLVAVKASILRGEGKPAEAIQVLDDYVANQNDFNAYWMRAVYLAEEGDVERAESDYRKLITFAENGAAGYEILGNSYASTGRLDQAVATLEGGLSAYPDNAALQRRLMRLLFQRNNPGDRERASETLAFLREQLPLDAELMTVEAVQMLTEPTPESLANSREVLEEAIKLAPGRVDAQHALITVAMQQGDHQAACDYAIEALEVNRNNPVLLSARARAELALGYAPTAVKFARQVLQEDPNNAEAWSVLVDGAVISRDRSILGQARTLIDSAVKRDAKNEWLLLSRARILGALEQPQAAIPELEAYCQTEMGSSSVAAYVMVADLYRLAGDMELAGQWIEKAEQLAPQNQSVVHARFLWLLSQERYEELGQISFAYIAAKEQNVATVVKAAELLLSLNANELKKEGVKLLDHAVSLAPTSVTIRTGLASSLYRVGDIERAKKVYRELLEQHPDNVRALNDLAWILQEQDQEYEAALELANRGLRLAPRDLYLLDTRGTIYSKMLDRLADARNDFQELAKLSYLEPTPEARTLREARALLKLVRVCVGLEDFADARRHAENGLKIDEEIGAYTEAERKEMTEVLQGPDN